VNDLPPGENCVIVDQFDELLDENLMTNVNQTTINRLLPLQMQMVI